jgi:hypothetical protein
MTFRSFAAVNGLRPPSMARETRAIDGGKTSETRGFREVDGAFRRAGAAPKDARLYRRRVRGDPSSGVASQRHLPPQGEKGIARAAR